MTFQESETLELKEIVVEDIKKEIIAFANSAGGTLYVGVADNGRVVGVDNPDTVTQQISNMVRAAGHALRFSVKAGIAVIPDGGPTA